MNRYGIIEKTIDEIRDKFQNDLLEIDPNLTFESNTPSGQLLEILTQMALDNQEFNIKLQSQFNPNDAEGVFLENICSMNNLTKQNGAFTLQNIEITINAIATLKGLDDNINQSLNVAGFTISDASGNNYILTNTETFNPGTYTRQFRAVDKGAVQSLTGTISNIITPEIGVVSVNNVITPTQIGSLEETDSQFKIRREKTLYKNGNGQCDNLQAELLALPTITDARVYQNLTNSPAQTVPPGNLYIIIQGTFTNAEIAPIIYRNNSISTMFGNESYNFITPRGDAYPIKYDVPELIPLYIKFDVKKYTTFTLNQTAIKEFIELNAFFSLNPNSADTYYISNIAQQGLIKYISSNDRASVLNMKISANNIDWFDTLTPPLMKNKYSISKDNIVITEV